MDKPTCETCPYWDSDSCVEEFWCACRRNPPTLEGDEERGGWLATHRENWCGEHPDFPKWIEEQRKDANDAKK